MPASVILPRCCCTVQLRPTLDLPGSHRKLRQEGGKGRCESPDALRHGQGTPARGQRPPAGPQGDARGFEGGQGRQLVAGQVTPATRLWDDRVGRGVERGVEMAATGEAAEVGGLMSEGWPLEGLLVD